MHPYIPHLLSDIHQAHRKEAPQPANEITFEEEMEMIELWDEQDHAHTFGYYCGLDPINFPPPDQLKTKDIKLVNKAFQQMMFSWNISIDLPAKMSARIAYTLIVDSLNEKVPIVESGFVRIDFCTGYAPDCKLKEYCTCLEFYNNFDHLTADQPGGANELPF